MMWMMWYAKCVNSIRAVVTNFKELNRYELMWLTLTLHQYITNWTHLNTKLCMNSGWPLLTVAILVSLFTIFNSAERASWMAPVRFAFLFTAARACGLSSGAFNLFPIEIDHNQSIPNFEIKWMQNLMMNELPVWLRPVEQHNPWDPCGKSQICGFVSPFMRTWAGHWIAGTQCEAFGHGSHFL